MGHRLSKIYTRTGDDGTTGLADGKRVSKSEPRIQALATQAKLSGDWLRVFDIRYATAGDPIKITREYVMFPAGSVEVLETGPLAEAATSVEELGFPRMISIHGIIQAEICKRSKTKR